MTGREPPRQTVRNEVSGIIAIAVTSLDGRITRGDEPGAAFASREDHVQFREAVSSCGAVIMGRTTYEVERERILRNARRSAPGPLRLVMTRDPGRFGADSVPGFLEFTSEPVADLADRLRSGCEGRIGILGGGTIYAGFAAAGLIDEWWITLEPRLFGRGTPLLATAAEQNLVLLEHRLLNRDTIWLRYGRRFPRATAPVY